MYHAVCLVRNRRASDYPQEYQRDRQTYVTASSLLSLMLLFAYSLLFAHEKAFPRSQSMDWPEKGPVFCVELQFSNACSK